jgi:Immunity protein 22
MLTVIRPAKAALLMTCPRHVRHPRTGKEREEMSSQRTARHRNGYVSIWIGTFPSIEKAEAYFGIPDEIGVYLPPDGFAKDLGLDDIPAERLEVNFEQMFVRPLQALLQGATYSASFIDQALEAASVLGIRAAQGIAFVYDYDYQAEPGWQRMVGPLIFVGSFPFARPSNKEAAAPKRDPRIEIRHGLWDMM